MGGCAATGDSPMNVLEMYELEVSKLSAICHYADFRDKATKTEISVFGRQALGAQRRRSPSLAGKVLIARSGGPLRQSPVPWSPSSVAGPLVPFVTQTVNVATV